MAKLDVNAGRDSTWLSEVDIAGGTVRADLVRISERIVAFELKGSNDSLRRLVNQAWYYGKAFDEVNLVAGHKHLQLAENVLPKWWGLWEVKPHLPAEIVLRRAAGHNPWQEPSCLASLLNRAELTNILGEGACRSDLRCVPAHELWFLAEKLLPKLDLHRVVLAALRERQSAVA